jgi:hypothetical protein|tara:strand:- start:3582 stop:3806 length:225 start_codon:yes stop_codon:yes gene_type:complete
MKSLDVLVMTWDDATLSRAISNSEANASALAREMAVEGVDVETLSGLHATESRRLAVYKNERTRRAVNANVFSR